GNHYLSLSKLRSGKRRKTAGCSERTFHCNVVGAGVAHGMQGGNQVNKEESGALPL
ncbi:unnamed protein product, partial [Orchesella dallaii]